VSGGPLSLSLPDAFVDAVAELVADKLDSGQPDWPEAMSRETAARYLDVPASRLEKDRSVPSRRWDGRVLYIRAELDKWLADLPVRG
jgi:hypothetical protein